MEILFERFLDDPEEHRAAEAYWEKMFARLEHERGPGPKWEPWLAKKPYQDGSPMFDRVCHARSKAVKIIQHDPKEFPSKTLDAWISVFGMDPKYDAMLDVVVIACVATDVSLVRAEELL
jgi:hypothetical protein